MGERRKESVIKIGNEDERKGSRNREEGMYKELRGRRNEREDEVMRRKR